MMKRLNNRGDTIVEVLLAIAVISAVLGGAFVSSNRSFNTTRRSQERGEALKLAESQLERLKRAAATPGSNVFSTTGYFCIDDTLTVRSIGDVNNFGSYAAECAQQPQAPGVTYFLSIEQDPSTVFTVKSLWDRLGGEGREEVRFTYRVYQ